MATSRKKISIFDFKVKFWLQYCNPLVNEIYSYQAERADQKHENNRSRLVSAPGANYTIVAVKLQMFGGETCHVHVKVDHAGHGNNRQK